MIANRSHTGNQTEPSTLSARRSMEG
jgi:hypothetical protein